MKMLVCTDGSEHSKIALEKAAIIAEGSNFSEVAIIHVFDNKDDASPVFITSDKQLELIDQLRKERKKEMEAMLADASLVFKNKNLKISTLLKEGHPAHTIVKVAKEEGFEMIVIGSRGLSGLEKVFLGSVSNAVVQEAHNCCVLIVK